MAEAKDDTVATIVGIDSRLRYRRPAAGDPRRCPHGRPADRLCVQDVLRARRLAAIADREIGRPAPAAPIRSDYGLTLDELRRHANRLVVEYGWTLDEVLEVLEVAPRKSVAGE